jgi:uncharacterized protein YchJ
MEYFHNQFPGEAKRETIVIDTSDHSTFTCRACALFESYCCNPECDCKDVLIYVEQQKSMKSMKFSLFSAPLAVLCYSLAKPTSEKNPSLALQVKQSPHAKAGLALVREYMNSHPEYVTQLQRHYDMMKESGKNLQFTFENNVPVRLEPKPDRNEPCFCGSGKKYKKCCLLKNK